MKKILILENGKDLRNMINDFVKNKNYEMEMIIAKNSGSKRIPNEIPDLIIADLTSIKKEKVELLMQLKNSPVISLVPFLLISSENGAGSEEMYSTYNYYLKKPFTKQDFFSLVGNILNHTNNLSPW